MGAKPDAGPGGYRRHPAEVPLHRIVVADGDRRLQVGRGREGPLEVHLPGVISMMRKVLRIDSS